MSSVNLSTRELAIKIVYYGPGLGGKTTSLRYIHRALKPSQRGQLISLATGSDRTLYFDFLPVRLPKLGGFRVRAQLYTVPGQVHYNATRKLVLARTDGIVFVADSHRDRMVANIESMENLVDNLAEQGRPLGKMPLVIQFNKRDIPEPAPVEELRAQLCPPDIPTFDTIATTGQGVFNALKTITTLVINDLRTSGRMDSQDAPTRVGTQEAHKPQPAAADDKLSAQSLGELGAEIEKLEPATTTSHSGVYELPTVKKPTSMGVLIEEQRHGLAVGRVEEAIEKGDWAGSIREADTAYRKFADTLCSAGAEADSFVLGALMVGVPAERFIRFRELSTRIRSGGGVSSSDALFGLFFLTDFVLRIQERKQRD